MPGAAPCALKFPEILPESLRTPHYGTELLSIGLSNLETREIVQFDDISVSGMFVLWIGSIGCENGCAEGTHVPCTERRERKVQALPNYLDIW